MMLSFSKKRSRSSSPPHDEPQSKKRQCVISPKLQKKRSRSSSPYDESQPKKVPSVISPKLESKLGKTFGDIKFLKTFQKLYYPKKTLDECAQYIFDSIGLKYIRQILSYVQSEILSDVDSTNSNFSQIFVMLMNTYIQYIFEKNGGNTNLLCLFLKSNLDVKLVKTTIENGNPIFFSEMLRIKLVNNDNKIQYVATLRNDIRLQEEKFGEILIVPSDDISHPPVILGKGSYGFVFKIMGVDGEWYIVKVFENIDEAEKDAKREWSALYLIMGTHPSLQQGIALQIDRTGDFKHIIVSKYQGDIALSRIHRSRYRFNLRELVVMFIELAEGISALHKLGLLHCDIKPDNIILQQNGKDLSRLILADFGISKKIGEISKHPNLHYTWFFRDMILFLADYMNKLNTEVNGKLVHTFVEPGGLSPPMDWYAFFTTILRTISSPSNDFLGFCSKEEEEARQITIRDSCVTNLIEKMKLLLAGTNFNIQLVRSIYFVLLNKQGPEKFAEIFKSAGVQLMRDGIYDEYLKMFHDLRDNHPMIAHVRKALENIRCEDPSVDISGPIRELNDLFVKIIRDGADLSLLRVLTINTVNEWFADLWKIFKDNEDLEKTFF